MANELHFPLFHGYVDRWLVSGVTETPVITKPTALHGAENEKLNTAPKDKPGEEQFKAERRAKATAWPAQLDTRPGGLVGGADNATPFTVYWPFDDIGVTYAWDCETPACLSAWAYTELDAAEAGSVPFDLITCGGAALWLNGEKLTEVTPYHHNEPVPTPLTLPLQKGRNKLLVFFDNYAERDATIILRLRWKGEGTAPEQVIPVGEADAGRLAEAEHLASRVLIMNEGRIIADGTVTALRERLANGERRLVGSKSERRFGLLSFVFPDAEDRSFLKTPAGIAVVLGIVLAFVISVAMMLPA